MPIDRLRERPDWLSGVPFYRLAFRDIASSTNERTAIFTVLPPGTTFGNKAPCEPTAERRPSWAALLFEAIANSYPFDILLRQRVQATVNLFILDAIPACQLPSEVVTVFLCHGALRLSCNHAGYAPLWREQVGGASREPTMPPTWPVLADDDARWAIRAVVDAVVAHAYGLTRDQYVHVLSTFNHRSYPKAPDLCLARFDELTAIGLDAFTKKHDPYWDIPPNHSLPEPVIRLPVPTEAVDVREQAAFYFGAPAHIDATEEGALRQAAERPASYRSATHTRRRFAPFSDAWSTKASPWSRGTAARPAVATRGQSSEAGTTPRPRNAPLGRGQPDRLTDAGRTG